MEDPNIATEILDDVLNDDWDNVAESLKAMSPKDLRTFYMVLGDLSRSLRGAMKSRGIPIPETARFSAEG
jgi:hypothetical protein